MELINPNLIGSSIARLIANSKEKFYAVTAWLDISNWEIILTELEKARERGVVIKLFFRRIEPQDAHTLLSMGIELIQVKRLHTKFFLNEKEVIVTSMNFIEASDLYSIDIGLQYKDAENYNKIYHYFLKYIDGENRRNIDYLVDDEKALIELYDYLSNRFTESKINYNYYGNYLFSKNLISVFDIFITPSEITLKYPVKNPDSNKVLALTNKITSKVKSEIITNKSKENYDYSTWDIDVSKCSTTDLFNILCELKNIN